MTRAAGAGNDDLQAVDDLFARAKQRHQAGLLEEAGTHYARVVALRPDHVVAHFNLGLVRQGLGDPDGAIACFDRRCG